MSTYCYAGNCSKCQQVFGTLYKCDAGRLCNLCLQDLELPAFGECWGGYDPGERDYSPGEMEEEKLRVEELKKTHEVEFLESEVARLKNVIRRRNRQLRALRSPQA